MVIGKPQGGCLSRKKKYALIIDIFISSAIKISLKTSMLSKPEPEVAAL